MRTLVPVAILLQLIAVGCAENGSTYTSELSLMDAVRSGPFVFEVEGRLFGSFVPSYNDFGCVTPFDDDSTDCNLSGCIGAFEVQIIFSYVPLRRLVCTGVLDWGKNLGSDDCIYEDPEFDLIESVDLSFSSEEPVSPVPEGSYASIGGYFHDDYGSDES